MAGGSIAGVVGSITWAHYVAAAINGYTITKKDQTWRLSATVVRADAYNLAQRPLLFVVPHAKGQWRWPILTIDQGPDVGPHQLRATLGPPEP